MSSRKSVGPRIEPWGNQALTEYSCEDFPYKTNRSLVYRPGNKKRHISLAEKQSYYLEVLQTLLTTEWRLTGL